MSNLRSVVLFVVSVCVGSVALSIPAQAPPRVNGVLIELNKPGTIEVALSVGAEDGVRVGDKLTVVHDGQVLGAVEVIKTETSRSTAKIVDVAAGKALTKNDSVKSR